MFKSREKVAKALNLPGDVNFSVIGKPTETYKDKLVNTIEKLLGKNSIRSLTSNASRNGTYSSYRFLIRIKTIEQVENFYKTVGQIEGTRSVL